MQRKQMKLMLFSFTHFLVDFACVFYLYRYLSDSNTVISVFLIYNFCAFALQMPIGLLADWKNKNFVFASSGCFLIALGYLGSMIGQAFVDLHSSLAMILVILVGIGNGCFHVGAGIEVLNESEEKSSWLGIFVSPGALGLYLGAIFSNQTSFFRGIVLIALVIAGCFMPSYQSQNVPISFRYPKYRSRGFVLVFLVLVVILRSYLGVILQFPWKNTFWGALMVASIVLGKMSGGFLADLIGTFKASAVSLGMAAIFFFGSENPICGILAIYCFNMTMPITLWQASKVLRKSKGFAFGLLTFGLFLGYLPVVLEFPYRVTSYVGYAVLAILSMIFLLTGIKIAERMEEAPLEEAQNQ